MRLNPVEKLARLLQRDAVGCDQSTGERAHGFKTRAVGASARAARAPRVVLQPPPSGSARELANPSPRDSCPGRPGEESRGMLSECSGLPAVALSQPRTYG